MFKNLEHKKLSLSLFDNLIYFLKYYHKSISANTLIEGFPLKAEQQIPDMLSVYNGKPLFISLARKAGFKSKYIKKEFKNISALVLPAIIILKDSTSCILEKIDKEKQTAVIHINEFAEVKEEISLSKLKDLYSGEMFLLKKDHFESEVKPSLLDKNDSHWFWGTIKKNFSIYKDVIIASILINIFVLTTPFFVMNVYDRVVPNFALETLWAMAIGICVIYVFDLVTKFIRAYYIDISSKKVDIIVSSKLFDKILNIKLEHKPKSIGSFANNIKDFELIKNFFSSSTMAVLVDLPFSILFLVAVFYISGSIVIVPMIFIALILIYSLLIRNPLHKSIEASNEAVSYKNGILIESLSGLETIKSLGASGHLRWKWEESTADISTKSLFTKMITTSITNVNAFFVQLTTIFIVIYGVYAISENELTLGGLIAAVILGSRAIGPMGQFASLISNYEQAKTSYNMLDNIMNLPEERSKNKAAIHKEYISGSFEFKDVSFFYNENKKVLDSLNFTVKHGEKIGIVGKIGSGKSTIMKLLMKLYDANEGEIIVDGIEIKQIEPSDVRKNIAYVSQDTLLFNGTLKENILYKYPYESDETLINATKTAQLLDFVNAHPEGFDLRVGERGDTLSGGQKKAISLARALVGNYSTLLLDEPTDSMDISTEKNLINALKNEIKDKTVILTTHKSSMLELVDRLIVVDNGKIVLDGEKSYVLNALSNKVK
ncbi:type I secretion system permease/ATPase [Poseidonibacter lekithochrous]|uniref:type I secretion system permease/ATPase n=1 Tax=Poseidonibacter TaxID=2321187 RepID=UPI001C096E33|nr:MULTISPECIES: type I secretion system permease/ATPase [Poseidonibacter]MBU3014093.1 type I secretion system permease/ATPase [Poseidonibacter lekithochrous]MDO6827391.1 type I secretion system permease/ATPase [Poseidonibacter sp. 1_MG-2023]